MTDYDILREYEAHNTSVPSYEEYLTMKDCAKMVFDAAVRETKLKELLRECRPYVDQAMPIRFNDNDIGWKPWQINRCTILTKIDELLK